MKLQLIQAPNMAQALRRIHAEMGSNAMIYETRNSVGGIEVLAGLPTTENTESTVATNKNDKSSIGPFFYDDEQPMVGGNQSYFFEQRLNDIDQTMRHISEKINSMNIQNKPIDDNTSVSKQYHNYYKSLGFNDEMINELFGHFIKKQKTTDELSSRASRQLLHLIEVPSDEFINYTTTVALVGPTGVGKTTTIVKLAERFIKNNSTEDLGIISLDIEDLCIKNKLSHYCDLFDIEFEFADSAAELNRILDKMRNKKLILIDTQGVSQRDNFGLNKLNSIFEKSKQNISMYLTLPCNQQESVLKEIIKNFSFNYISGCILTKLDEAPNITPALGIVLKEELTIAYMCNGQDIERHIIFPTKKDILSTLPVVFNHKSVEEEQIRQPINWLTAFRADGFGLI